MRLDDNFDDDYDYDDYYEEEIVRTNHSHTIKIAVILVSISTLFILIIVLLLNQGKKTTGSVSGNQVSSQYFNTISNAESEHAMQTQIENSVEGLISGSSMTAQDLDIWDESEEPLSEEESDAEAEEGNAEDINDDPATDGKHTLIIHDNGEQEWVDINQYLAQNSYDPSGFVFQNPLMRYYENNTRISFVGVDISKNQDYVDFNELKRAGIEFVMIRLGQRGYTSGEITLDEYFADNIKRATDAGLDVGVIFFSQAVNVDEAKEEAQFVIDTLEEYEIQYPVVFHMDTIRNEVARIDALDKMQRTNIAITFMDMIKENGYFPMLYGDKEWLIQKLSLGSMIGYDVWLSQERDLPDYPYQFVMWQYTTHGSIPGIAGDAHLNICFVDYSVK